MVYFRKSALLLVTASSASAAFLVSQPAFTDSRTSTAQNMYADGFLMPQDVISWRDQQTTSCYHAPSYADPNISVRAPPSQWPEVRGDYPTQEFFEETKAKEERKIHMWDYWMQPVSYMEELKTSNRRSESQWTPDATLPFFTTGSLSTPESRWARVDPGFTQSTPSFNQYTSSSYATGRWTSVHESEAMHFRQMHNYVDAQIEAAPQEAVVHTPVIEESPVAYNEPDIRMTEPAVQEIPAVVYNEPDVRMSESHVQEIPAVAYNEPDVRMAEPAVQEIPVSFSETETVYLQEPVFGEASAPWSQPEPVIESPVVEEVVMEMPAPEPASDISKDLADKISAYEKKIEEMREVEAEFVDILNQSRSRYVNDLNDILTVESSSDYYEEESSGSTSQTASAQMSGSFEEHPGAEMVVETATTTTAKHDIDVLEAELGDVIMNTIRHESAVNTQDAYLSAGTNLYQHSYYGSPAPQYSNAGRSGPNVYQNGHQNIAPHYSNAYDRP